MALAVHTRLAYTACHKKANQESGMLWCELKNDSEFDGDVEGASYPDRPGVAYGL